MGDKPSSGHQKQEVEGQQNPTSGTNQSLFCKGHSCVKCGKCGDWQYTGDPETWKWIQNCKNWNNIDWERWDNGRVWEHFKHRDGTTCDRFSPVSFSIDGRDLLRGIDPNHTDFLSDDLLNAFYDYRFILLHRNVSVNPNLGGDVHANVNLDDLGGIRHTNLIYSYLLTSVNTGDPIGAGGNRYVVTDDRRHLCLCDNE